MILLVRKVRKDISECLMEHELDTIESSLKKRAEEHLSSGNIDEAEAVSDTIDNLNKIPVCEE